MSQLLKVGKIANTHGLKGEVKVIALTDDPKRFNDLEYVIIEGKTISVEGCKFQKDRVIVKLEGIDRIEDADLIIYEDYWSPGRIIDTFYDSLNSEDIKYIESIPSNSNSKLVKSKTMQTNK